MKIILETEHRGTRVTIGEVPQTVRVGRSPLR